MAKRSTRILLTTLCSLAVVVGVAFYFRQALVVYGANRALAEYGIAVTQLQGLQVNRSRAALEELELDLQDSGMRLMVTDASLAYSMPSLFSIPVPERLVIGAARLVRDPTLLSDNSAETAPLQLSELLQVLRSLPLGELVIHELAVFDRAEPLDIELANSTEQFHLQLVSGTLLLQANLVQSGAADTGEFQISLTAGLETIADFKLILAPVAEGFQVAGKGFLTVADVAALTTEHLSEPLALPFSAADLDWEVEGFVADDFLATTPSMLSLGINAGSTMALTAGVLPDFGALALTISDRAEFKFVPDATLHLNSGIVPLQMTGTYQEEALAADMRLTAGACTFSGVFTCALGFVGSAALAAYTIGTEPTASANATQQTTDPVIISNLAFTGAGTANIDSTGFIIRTEPAATLTATLQPLVFGEYSLATDFTVQDLQVQSDTALRGTATVITQALTLQSPQTWLPRFELAADLAFDTDKLTFDTKLLLPAASSDPGIRAKGSYALVSGQADIALTLPTLEFTGAERSLSSWLGEWPFTFDLMTGSLAAQLALHWQPATTTATGTAETQGVLTGTVNAQLIDAAGYYGEYFFSGMNFPFAATLDTAAALPVSTGPLHLEVAALDVGLPLANLTADLQLDGSRQLLNLASLHAETLGGTVSASAQTYDFKSARNQLTVQFAGLRLENMLALAEYKGVAATGAVSGEIPLFITANGVEVEAGTLFAVQPGGSIRYLDAVLDGGNVGLDLVNQALSNYQFQSLESTIDYRPDGELLLAMKLQGHNPDMNNGQRINLNLNLSDNIPVLLESLRARRAIEDFLEQQYEE